MLNERNLCQLISYWQGKHQCPRRARRMCTDLKASWWDFTETQLDDPHIVDQKAKNQRGWLPQCQGISEVPKKRLAPMACGTVGCVFSPPKHERMEDSWDRFSWTTPETMEQRQSCYCVALTRRNKEEGLWQERSTFLSAGNGVVWPIYSGVPSFAARGHVSSLNCWAVCGQDYLFVKCQPHAFIPETSHRLCLTLCWS